MVLGVKILEAWGIRKFFSYFKIHLSLNYFTHLFILFTKILIPFRDYVLCK